MDQEDEGMAVRIEQERINGIADAVVILTVGDFDPKYKDELESCRINSHQLEDVFTALRLWIEQRKVDLKSGAEADSNRVPELIEISDDGKHTIITREFGK